MLNIIPQPVSIMINREKKGFTLHAGTTVTPYAFTDDFIAFARSAFNKKVHKHEDTGDEKSVILKIDGSIAHDEGYTLKCENRRVYITAKTEAGLYYGLQTLKQMLLQTDGKIPYTEIIDYPRFEYRGFGLDTGKYAYSVGDIKRIADLMAFHKLNVLRLTGNTQANYTKEDMREIVAYCHERKIKVNDGQSDFYADRLIYVESEKSVKDKNLLSSEAKLINSLSHPYSLDYPYGINSIKKVCNYDGELTDGGNGTWGIEGRVNTDYAPNMKKFEYLAFPRLGAIAETAWAEKGFQTFATFLYKAVDYCKYLDQYGIRYARLKKAHPSIIGKYASVLIFRIKKLKNIYT